jgi:hypothetical protein
LNQFPELDQLGLGNKSWMQDRLIPNVETRWDALEEQKRSKEWNHLFAHQQFADPANFIPYPTGRSSWNVLTDRERTNARAVVWNDMADREKIFNLTSIARSALHTWLADFKTDAIPEDVKKFEELTGICLFGTEERKKSLKGLKGKRKQDDLLWRYKFEVHSFRGAQRVAPDGTPVNRVIVSITQKRIVPLEAPDPSKATAATDDFEPEIEDSTVEEELEDSDPNTFVFRGGCTLIFDLNSLQLRYVIRKLVDDSDGRLKRQRAYRTGEAGASLRATYFGPAQKNEPFALLHSDV